MSTSAPSRRRSQFRPCIDLHSGQVKQIVGGTLTDDGAGLQTNFVATHPPAYYAELYRTNNLTGGHIVKLGPGNEDAAREAMEAWPRGFHLAGGINEKNARGYLEAGAQKVVITSYLFPGGKFEEDRLRAICELVGKEQLVVDISCRRRGDRWIVAMNKWQDLTDMEVNEESIRRIEQYCSELLIHAADVEGLCQGIDQDLVSRLGDWVRIPCTYAGGAKDISDLELVDRLSGGKVDLTYGSSLDIFGGKTVKFDELVALSHRMRDEGKP